MWIIVSVPIVAGIAAYLFTENTIDQFRSSGQISTGFTTIDQIQITDERFNARDAEVKFNNLLASMNSGLVTNLLSYRLILHDIESTETPYRMPAPEFASTPDEREQVKGLFRKKLTEFSPLSASDSSFALMRKFLNGYGYGYGSVRGGLAVRRIVNTDYVQVDFVSENPNLSAFAANAFCEEFIKYYNSIKSERSGESVDFLKQLADQKKIELDDKLEQLKIFKSSNSFLNVQQEGEAKLTQISELERRRDESRSKLYGLNLTIQRLETEIKNYGNNSSTSNNNNQKIIELRNRINKLNEKYITGGSSDSRLLDSLNNLRDQLQVMMNAIPQQTTQPTLSLYDLQSRLKDAQINHEVERTNLSQLEAKLRELQFSVSGYASKEAQVSAIQQEVDLASKEYLDAVNKYNEAKNKSLLNNTIRQTLTATPPVSPESSKRLIIIALATFASFGLCLFVVVVLELIDLTVRTPDKFKRIVGLPLAGPVNVIDTKNFNIRSFFGQ
ncbi:MAG: hypothetical protein HC859_06335, partial [Bacteroidia bacterium]|nr:hypothetical protein [Bacteroidia bacterium]